MAKRLTVEGLMEMLDGMRNEIKALKEQGGPGFKEDPKFQEAVNDVFEKNRPKKIRFGAPVLDGEGKAVEGQTKYGKQFEGLTDFLRGCLIHDGRCKKDWQFDRNEKTGMSEGTPAQGGYTVPIEYATQIINLITDYSIIRGIARSVPMGSSTRQIPRQLTQPTVYWVNEEADKTIDKPTLTAVTQTAHKMAVIVTFTDELLADSIAAGGIDNWVAELIAEQMALEEDSQGLMGSAAPFTGVRYAVGVNVVLMSGASVVYSDLIDLTVAVPTKVAFSKTGTKLKSAVFITNQVGFGLVFKMVDSTGKPIFDYNTQTLLGWPLHVTNEITAVAGLQPVIFGDFKKGMWISDRAIGKNGKAGMNVLMSQEASAPTSNESAFMQDETWGRFVKRLSIDVVQPDAFGYLDIA